MSTRRPVNAQTGAMSVTQTMALNAGSSNYATPLVLDLDGDGVRTLGITAGVQFDIRAEGKAVGTGWVDAHDGLLALDRNGDGVINDGGELFGSATTLADGSKAANGYAALQSLDSNGDGQITSADSAFGALRVWVDANSDGVSQADELKTLAQLHIAAINTGADHALTLQNGNIVGLTSSYTSTDGSSHASADVWFLAQQTATTVAATLQQQVSGLSNAIAAYAGTAAPTPAAPPASLLPAAAAGAEAGAQAMADAMQHYRSRQALPGAVAALDTQRDDPQRGAGNWFSVPKR